MLQAVLNLYRVIETQSTSEARLSGSCHFVSRTTHCDALYSTYADLIGVSAAIKSTALTFVRATNQNKLPVGASNQQKASVRASNHKSVNRRVQSDGHTKLMQSCDRISQEQKPTLVNNNKQTKLSYKILLIIR